MRSSVMFDNQTWTLLLQALNETLYMVGVSGALTALFGIPLGVILIVTRSQGIMQNTLLNKSLGFIVNVIRSIPFIVLIVALIPLARWLVGSSIGPTAAVVSLTIGAIPFYARIVENAVSEVDHSLVEASLSMGASPVQVIRYILIPESFAAMINGFTVTLITLVSYSAMAGAVGGGGLGSLAIRYGYQRFDTNMMLLTIVVLIILIQVIQLLGDAWVKYLNRYRSKI